MSEDTARRLSSIASLVRSAAYGAMTTPGWGRSILASTGLVEGEVSKPVDSAIVPMRREPDDELVRVDLHSFDQAAASFDVRAALIGEIEPFIIGVGKVRAENTAEGFKVFLCDNGESRDGHINSSGIEITRKMIDAGVVALMNSDDLAPALDNHPISDRSLERVVVTLWIAFRQTLPSYQQGADHAL